MPLATVADLEARIGPLSPEQAARAPALLADASAEVQAETGQTIVRVADDLDVLHGAGGVIRLPQRPVESVSAVFLIDGQADIELSGWAWDGRDRVDIRFARSARSRLHDTETYRVRYSHGWPADGIPQVIVMTVCGMVARVLTAPSQIDGIVSETIGQYSYQLQQGVGNGGTSVRMTTGDRQRLARAGFRRGSATVFVRSR